MAPLGSSPPINHRHDQRTLVGTISGMCGGGWLPLVRRGRGMGHRRTGRDGAGLGTAADRRRSEAMIRRLLQALDPDLLNTSIGIWLACPGPPTGTAPGQRAI